MPDRDHADDTRHGAIAAILAACLALVFAMLALGSLADGVTITYLVSMGFACLMARLTIQYFPDFRAYLAGRDRNPEE
jgi:hypothetical protein